MINNNPFRTFYPTSTTNYAAQELKKYSETAKFREKAGLKGEVNENCFAAKLKKADEYLASGESYGATDSIGIILRQMDAPTAENPTVSKEVYHNGVKVRVERQLFEGNTIWIGGTSKPDWINAYTSVGTVKIDMNDSTSLQKCLDMFSPEDMTAIMEAVMKAKQAREAGQQIDEMENELVETDDDKEEDSDSEKTVSASAGVVSAMEAAEKGVKEHKRFV